MSFNADDFLTALEKPTYTENGRTYVGRLLSIEEYMPFADGFMKINNGELETVELLTFARSFLRAIFPKKLSMSWTGDPVELIMRSPLLIQILADFFGCQVQAIHGKSPNLKTSGNDLPEKP